MQRSGTDFHKSGKVITAFPGVVADCQAQDIILINTPGTTIKVTKVLVDDVVDLALLTPAQEIGKTPTLSISKDDRFTIGSQVIHMESTLQGTTVWHPSLVQGICRE